MTGIGNNLPKSAMGINNAQNLQKLQKTDKSGLVGEAQKATAADNSRPEGTTLKTHIEVHCDGHIYYFSDGQDNGVYISFRVNKDGGYMSYSNEYGTVDFSTNDGYQWSVTGDWKNTGKV